MTDIAAVITEAQKAARDQNAMDGAIREFKLNAAQSLKIAVAQAKLAKFENKEDDYRFFYSSAVGYLTVYNTLRKLNARGQWDMKEITIEQAFNRGV